MVNKVLYITYNVFGRTLNLAHLQLQDIWSCILESFTVGWHHQTVTACSRPTYLFKNSNIGTLPTVYTLCLPIIFTWRAISQCRWRQL